MVNELSVKTNTDISLIKNGNLSELIKPLYKEVWLLDVPVAGTYYAKDKTVFGILKEGDELILRREPENRYDKKAILVLAGDGRKLGYVPEQSNAVISRLMDAGKMIKGKVIKTYSDEEYNDVMFGIYLVDF